MPDLIMVREAELWDFLFLFKLKNEPIALENSKSKLEVGLIEHLLWFIKVNKSKENLLFVAKFGGEKIGLIHFSNIKNKDGITLSININNNHRKKNLGSLFLIISERMLFLKIGECRINAYVVHKNTISFNFFLKNKYDLVQKLEEIYKFQKLITKKF